MRRLRVDALSQDEAIILGQRLKRPPRIGTADWLNFWRGPESVYEQRYVPLDRWRAEPFPGVVVNRPLHVDPALWFRFWGGRSTHTMMIHA